MRKTVVFTTLFSILILAQAFAAVPHLLNYQGRLSDKDGKPLADGTYSITFRIFNAETAGTKKWEETQSVTVSKGVFAVLLGAVTPLNIVFDEAYFLEMQVGTEVMSPRQRIASAGYAFRAEHGVPRGVVVIWSGKIADIPSGWALCDGTNGTPDLRDKFVIGANRDDNGIPKTNVTDALTQAGGSATKNLAHTHNIPATATIWGRANAVPGMLAVAYPNESASPQRDNPTGSGGSASQDVLNPYYALAFIIKL